MLWPFAEGAALERRTNRPHSFGQVAAPSPIDRLGIWLSGQRIRTHVRDFSGKRLGDFGCGYNATFVSSVLDRLAAAVLVDVALAPDLLRHPKVLGIEGRLPHALAEIDSATLDIVLCINVLEHLWEPLAALEHVRRVLSPGGIALINVPSWRGKRFLEFSAFRLGLSPAEEMDDHKAYYDPKDLWPLLVRAGFRPHRIRCSTHKFGLNTFAACRVDYTARSE
jgi:SAM-dependent methyltransferase